MAFLGLLKASRKKLILLQATIKNQQARAIGKRRPKAKIMIASR
jgi:hypothetical protein